MKRLFLISLAFLLSVVVYGNESSFPLRDYDDLFVLEVRDNSTDFGPLNSFVDKYFDVIKDGKAQVYVTGYNDKSVLSKDNSAAAAVYVDKIKSELKGRGLSDDHIVTESLSGTYDENPPLVLVRIGIPKGLGKGKAAEYNPSVPATPVVAAPVVAVLKPVVEAAVEPVAPKKQKAEWELKGLYLRTNMLFLAAATPNAGLEWRFNDKSSIMVNGGWARWNWDDDKRQYHVWYVLPEYRRYLGSQHRWYIGLQGQYGEADVMLTPRGYQGEFYGGSVTGGYNLPIGRRLSLDFNIGLGYTEFKHDKYRWQQDAATGNSVRVIEEKDRTRRLIGPNQIGINLVWHIAR